MIHDSTTKAEQSSYGLRSGSYGWRHDNWRSCFYPDDLPEDWQLAYYANEFSAVLVPRAYWQADTGYESASWPDDVPAHFRFYIEWPGHIDAVSQSLCLQQCRALGDLLGGIIVNPGIQLNTDLAVIKRQQIWTPENKVTSGVAMLALGEQDLRAQRQWLEQFSASAEQLHCVLISDAAQDIEALRKFKTLIELLGL